MAVQGGDLRATVEAFFESEILPRHRDWLDHVARRAAAPFLPALQAKARAAGLWNLGLTERMSNRDYAPLAEIMGRLPWASEVFNCQAPDVPNMIMLQAAATPEQKKRWLEPLLEGRVRSAFGMTEPDVASSDATNIATTLRRDGDDWVVNGPQMVHHRRRPSRLRLCDRGRRVAAASAAHRPAFLRDRADGRARSADRSRAALSRLGGQRRAHRRARVRGCARAG
jgi:Acyl-CoA dehydrogenase, N-terminal domain